MKNLYKNPKKAFSLVEISIVILIIGLLIAGISKAGDMIFDVGLKSASSITKGAKVGRMANLSLWLETSSSESILEKERFDGTVVSIWRDINPQSSSKFIFKKTGSPIYVEKGQNNLPAIGALSSANNYTPYTTETSSTVTTFSSSQIFSSGAYATIFVVLKPKAILGVVTNLVSFCPTAACAAGNEISVGMDATAKIVFSAMSGSSTTGVLTSSSAYASKNLIIVSALKDTANQKIYVNGGDLSSLAPANAYASSNAFTGTFKIGGASATATNDGVEVYEVILFSSALSAVDRQTVETYLGKKYNISMAKTS